MLFSVLLSALQCFFSRKDGKNVFFPRKDGKSFAKFLLEEKRQYNNCIYSNYAPCGPAAVARFDKFMRACCKCPNLLLNLELEGPGTAQIQIFHLAHYTRPHLDLGRTIEISLHLTLECQYTRRIWDLAAIWVAQPGLRSSNWKMSSTTLDWWSNVMMTPSTPRKAVRTITMLWEVWKERNARVFQHWESSVLSLFARIKNRGEYLGSGGGD